MAQLSLIQSRRRKGLAPVELVMWLPILLFVAGLMVVFGTMNAWRIRGEVVARDAAWRLRWPRTGLIEPAPELKTWPADADMTVRSDDSFGRLNDRAVDHPVMVGPLPNGFNVHPHFDFSRGGFEGVSEIEREYPLMSRLGRFESGEIRHPLFDGMWVTARLSPNLNFSNSINYQESYTWGTPNVFRRTLVLYELPVTDQTLPDAFSRAANGVFTMTNLDGLSVLDDDEDFIRYRGGAPDFHPYVPDPYDRFRPVTRSVNLDLCLTDPVEVYEDHVVDLLDGMNEDNEVVLGYISLLPRNMTSAFLSLYEARINELEQLIDDLDAEAEALEMQLKDPGLTPEQRLYIQQRLAEIPGLKAAASAEIPVLQEKIDQLTKYQMRLPEIEQRLAEKAVDYYMKAKIPMPLKD